MLKIKINPLRLIFKIGKEQKNAENLIQNILN